MRRPGVEPATSRLQVQHSTRPLHYRATNDGDNMSDHCAISVTVNIPAACKNNIGDFSQQHRSKLLWDKANIDGYRTDLYNLLVEYRTTDGDITVMSLITLILKSSVTPYLIV